MRGLRNLKNFGQRALRNAVSEVKGPTERGPAPTKSSREGGQRALRNAVFGVKGPSETRNFGSNTGKFPIEVNRRSEPRNFFPIGRGVLLSRGPASTHHRARAQLERERTQFAGPRTQSESIGLRACSKFERSSKRSPNAIRRIERSGRLTWTRPCELHGILMPYDRQIVRAELAQTSEVAEIGRVNTMTDRRDRGAPPSWSPIPGPTLPPPPLPPSRGGHPGDQVRGSNRVRKKVEKSALRGSRTLPVFPMAPMRKHWSHLAPKKTLN